MPSSEGYKNLIPMPDRPEEEQRAIQRKGGQANKERIEREKQHQEEVRTFAEIAADLMQRMIKNEKTGELASTKQVIMAGLIAKAAKGDTKAFDFVSDETGLIAVHEYADYDRLTADSTFLSGIKIFADNAGGVIAGTISLGE